MQQHRMVFDNILSAFIVSQWHDGSRLTGMVWQFGGYGVCQWLMCKMAERITAYATFSMSMAIF